jgi:ribosomal protein S5
VRVKAPEHVADHAGALDRFRTRAGRERQAHARHRVEDAALHRLLTVADVRQGAALDDAQRVFEVGALRVVGDADGVVGGRGRRGRKEIHEVRDGAGAGSKGAKCIEHAAPCLFARGQRLPHDGRR